MLDDARSKRGDSSASFWKRAKEKESMAPKRLKDKEERIWEDETTMAESASQHFEKRT